MTGQVYVYAWGNNERRAALKGRLCVIEARGAMRTVLVRFLDNGERVTTSIRALRKVEAFQPGNAISRENGGGGNRTRVTSQPDAADLQGDRKSDPAEPPRPRLSNTRIPHRGRPAKRAGDWAMADVAMATSRSAVPTTTVSGTCTSRLSPPPDGRGGSRFDDGSRLSHPHAAAACGEDASPQIGETYSCCRFHSGGLRLRGVARPHSSFRYRLAACARAQVDAGPLAFAGAVAGVGRDRPAGVGLGSVPSLPVDDGLLLQRVELVRDPAGESVPGWVAGTAREDVAGSGALADQVCGGQVRVAVGGACVPAAHRLVLSGASA